MENNPENKIYSAGYADSIHGSDDFSAEFSSFYEKEPDGTVGASNLYVLASGTAGTSNPEVTARFTVKKILYEYFHSLDYVDANKLAVAMRMANNEIYEYAKVQGEKMSAAAIAVAVTDGKASIATVGGCRAYIIRKGKVYQITEDPAVLEEKVQSGELTQEEAYGPDGEGMITALGLVKDITTDVYDGIEVHDGDTLLMCSSSLDTFIGKKEILDAVGDNSPRSIVQNLLSLPSLGNANVPASVGAIRIYDSESVETMIRVDGSSPVDTDLNMERKEIELIRKTAHRKTTDGGNQKKKDKLPAIILGILAFLLLLAGGVYAAGRAGLLPESFRAKYLGNIIPPQDTPTPTIDWVRESMTVYELTAEAEKAAAVAATVDAWPTQTPYPTFTPVFIDLDADTPTEIPSSVGDITDEGNGDDEIIGNDGTDAEPVENTDAGEQAAAVKETAVPEEETPEPVVKENYIDEKSDADMIYIPAGNFLLGSDPAVDEYAFEDEESPQLKVYLDGYWIGKTEVTNAQYLKCVQAGVCDQTQYMAIYNMDLVDYPVSYVTVDQAERFCSWIGGHLPTEYQWEKAARGTDGRIYPWGSEEPTLENDLANVPNYVDADGNGYDLFPVNSFPKGESPYGLADMAGNVWEWTSTWFSTNYYETLAAEEEISGSTVRNPRGPEGGSTQVIRGGSCASTEVNNYPAYTRTANRSYLNMSSSYYVGFRCVVPDIDEAEVEPADESMQPERPGQPGGPGQQGPRP